MGTVTGGSPPSTTSAETTEPHWDEPSRKAMHSASVPPTGAWTGESGSVSACEKTRSPVLPVSRSTSSIVWHVVVPGTQTFTLTQGSLKYWLDEQPAPFTPIATTFGPPGESCFELEPP